MPIKSVCFSGNSIEEIKGKIEDISDLHPTLGFIFSSVALDIKELSSSLLSSDFAIFGSSTSGEILPLPGEEPILEQSAVCCLLELDSEAFSVSLFEKGSISEHVLGTQIGEWGSHIFQKPGFIIAISGLKNNGEEISKGISMVSPPGTPVFGGMAGDDNIFLETYVFSEKGYSTNGAVVIVFDQTQVSLTGLATSGWAGVGVEMVVTSSEGNIVHTINNRPAIDLYKEYLNIDEEILMKIGVLYPLLIKKPDGTSVLRAIMATDTDTGSLIFAGSIPQNTHVQFSSSFGYDIIEKSVRDIKDYYTNYPDVDLIIFFSCMARLKVAGHMINDEVNMVSDLWRVPSFGFFTYGEISNDEKGNNCFFNESMTLVLIRSLVEEK